MIWYTRLISTESKPIKVDVVVGVVVVAIMIDVVHVVGFVAVVVIGLSCFLLSLESAVLASAS